LNDLDVNEMGSVEFVVIAEQAGLDSCARLGLQENPVAPKRQRRSRRLALLPNHDRSRSLQDHALSPVQPDQHLFARGPRREPLELGQQVVGQGLSGVGGPAV
jgi:hypothetical protein